MKKSFLTVVALCLIMFLSGCCALSEDSAGFQLDADIARLRNIKEIGGYIDEYKKKTGKYPLQNRLCEDEICRKVLMVYIATEEQSEISKIKLGRDNIHVLKFVEDLEKGLGRTVELPSDPQKYPHNRPNFYSYYVTEAGYALEVVMHRYYSFSSKAKKNHWYPLQISNIKEVVNSEGYIWNYKDLMLDEGFIREIKRPMYNPHHFRELESHIRINTDL